MSEFVTVFKSSGVSAVFPSCVEKLHCRRKTPRLLLKWVSRELLPCSGLPCRRGRKNFNGASFFVPFVLHLGEVSWLSLELFLQDTLPSLHNPLPLREPQNVQLSVTDLSFAFVFLHIFGTLWPQSVRFVQKEQIVWNLPPLCAWGLTPRDKG